MASAIPETPKREQYVYMARLAKRTERYEDMVKYMEKLVIENSTPGVTELTVEERNLLVVAYKNLIGPLRAAWRNFKSMEQKEENHKNEEHMSLVKDYRLKVESDLNLACGGILKLLESHLVPSASTSESKVYYLRLKGDYHRYMAEFKVGEERKAATDDTMSCYKAAQDIAHTDLAPMHPTRVALALNISVFLCEFLGSSKKASATAKQAFKEAIDEFGTVGEESDKDNPLYMKLLKDFFKLWISDAQEYYGV